ncbi:DUF4011 domain-containing protein [Vibrio parahaemolyticus]|uniref:DUF4011 domain-containing protein n=2 Tax=Vibrio parahaemolyticus TaxID=670 RepID=UPI003B66E610
MDLRVRIKVIRTAAKNNVPRTFKSPINQPTKGELMRNSGMPIVYPDNFLISAFEGMRQRLLDTSGGRSRLLNLDQNGRSFVRIVDELPDQLMKLLMSEKAMHVAPVPEPTSTQLVEHGFLRWDDEHEKFMFVVNSCAVSRGKFNVTSECADYRSRCLTLVHKPIWLLSLFFS